ncbi:unnamed protein product (macronuclear) [Paramecium tetraurelia]|uniref:Tubulin-tyrosine ligase family protein n=1 Tax=Paramecium tetraurelia TaxID=5888 RepID=A0D8Z1_PARTE|nr:uncharacterized protein GSPATT00014454001 [Paramecium tetraurelia]CAK79508.1 unnamed protein product [Paramecium tetraurelia]|eukprot:XP_001446905.1 hypothetical protein (macronuclear) [Paramecium tetraurelia strain d4-2]
MFLQAMKFKDNRYDTQQQRLEPIQLKYSPKEPRQHTPEGFSKIGLFNSTQFQRKQSIEKRKRSSQAEGKRPQSSVQRIPRTAFLKNTFATQYVVMIIIKTGSSFVRMEITVLQLGGSYKDEVGLQNNRQVLSKFWIINCSVNFIWKQSNKGFNYSNLTQKKVCINHLEHHHEISNKNKLHDNLKMHCQRINKNMDDFVPITFSINLDSMTLQWDLKKFVDFFIQIKKEGNQKNIWLLKPPDLNRGRGIQLFSDLKVFINQVEEFCKIRSANQKTKSSSKGARGVTITYPDQNEKESGQAQISFTIDQSGSNDRIIVLQKYLETPLLYNGRKFDFRVWVLIDHTSKYYFFKEGYLRLASEHFDVNNLKSLYIHLTNNAIQKNHPGYGKYELGNQLSFQDLQHYLNQQRNTKVTSAGIVLKMKELIHQTIHCACSKLRDNRKDFQFEIFGYDFMVDKNGHIWLIEINTNPCIEESSPLLQKLIPRMLNDAFRLTIDKIFPPFKTTQENFLPNLHEYAIPGYSDKDNLWDYMGQI